MSTFEAGVQYNDHQGTVAADGADNLSMKDFLIERGLASPEEFVIGYRISFGDNHGREIEPGLTVYLSKGTFDEPANVVRAVDVSISTSKFFSFLKRFDMVMTLRGLQLDGVSVEGPVHE